jgi:hypothetical protein
VKRHEFRCPLCCEINRRSEGVVIDDGKITICRICAKDVAHGLRRTDYAAPAELDRFHLSSWLVEIWSQELKEQASRSQRISVDQPDFVDQAIGNELNFADLVDTLVDSWRRSFARHRAR